MKWRRFPPVRQLSFLVIVLCLNLPPTAADFSCVGKSVGYYADVFLGCKTFYVCDDHGGKATFHCGPGTIFNQKVRVCDWPSSSHCESAPDWYFLNDFTYGDRIPSSARPHQRRRNKRRRKPTKKKTTRKIIYFPAYYNLKADDTGGGDFIWNSNGESRYFWDETAHKIVWDHPIPRRQRPSYVTPQPSLVKKVTWDHPIPLNTDPPPPDDTTVWKHPRRMMLYYKT